MGTDSSKKRSEPHQQARGRSRQPKPKVTAEASSLSEADLSAAHDAVLQVLECLDDLRDHVTAPSDPDQYLPEAREAAREAGYLSPRAPMLTERVLEAFKTANPILMRTGESFRGFKMHGGETGFRIGPVEEPSAHDAVLKFAHFIHAAANMNLLAPAGTTPPEPQDRDRAIRTRISTLPASLKRHKVDDRLKIEFAAALQQLRHPAQLIARQPRSSRRGSTIAPADMTKNRLTLGQAVKYLKQHRIEIAHRALRDWTKTKRKEPLPCDTQLVGKREIMTIDRDDLEEWVDRWLLATGREAKFGKGASYETNSYEESSANHGMP